MLAILDYEDSRVLLEVATKKQVILEKMVCGCALLD
jgi:hypothetical protein